MSFNFDQIIPRENTNCVKYDFREPYFGNKDVVPMWVADMDFAVPPFVTEALKQRVDHPIYGYSYLSDDYFSSIISWFENRHDWTIEKDWILHSPGIVTALNLLVQALTDPKDTIVVQPPVYFPFFWAVEKNDRKVEHNELLNTNGRYTIDFDDLDRKLEKASMFIFCSPHNPVGRVWSKDELMKVGELCVKHNVLVISDEIHCDLVLEGYKHMPLASVSPEVASRTITCVAPSKTFNLAGLSTSSVIIENEDIREKYKGYIEKTHLSANLFGAVASEAAYTHGGEWLDGLQVYLAKNRDLVSSFFKEKLPGIVVTPLEATYLLWLDFSGLGLENDEVKDILINKVGVGLNDGRMFGPGGEGFFRMNIGCPRSTVEEALIRMHESFTSTTKSE